MDTHDKAARTLRTRRITRRMLAILVMALPLTAVRIAQPQSQSQSNDEWTFHSLLPLGSTPLALKPAGTPLTLMATAESPMFEGWRRVTRGNRTVLLDASGTPVRQFPKMVRFRVSASTRPDRMLPFDKPFPVTGDDPSKWLKQLSFRLKIFHGLDAREVQPATVQHLGVPPDVPYDERIYLVTFELKDVPAGDRLVLEVFAPDGTRVGKFHLELL